VDHIIHLYNAVNQNNYSFLEYGKLFGFGKNEFGQLGNGNNKSTNVPEELKFFDQLKLKELICGSHFTFGICGISFFI
jgi:alpha-tubulin suppressor-like RCC1 family protein